VTISSVDYRFVAFAVVGAAAGACGGVGEDRAYTLYRSSRTDSAMRIHVATFDVDEKETYNRENCDSAGKLFQSQPGVTVKYWCEKGRYRK
jgi:hypothetical protein